EDAGTRRGRTEYVTRRGHDHRPVGTGKEIQEITAPVRVRRGQGQELIRAIAEFDHDAGEGGFAAIDRAIAIRVVPDVLRESCGDDDTGVRSLSGFAGGDGDMIRQLRFRRGRTRSEQETARGRREDDVIRSGHELVEATRTVGV